MVETHLARPAFLALQHYSRRDAEFFGEVVRSEIAPLEAKLDESNRKLDEINLELKSSIQDVNTSTAAAIQDIKSLIQDCKKANQITCIVLITSAATTVYLASERSGLQSQERNTTDVQIANIAADSQLKIAKLDLEATRIAADSQLEIAKLDLEATLEAARIAADSQLEIARINAAAKRDQGMAG